LRGVVALVLGTYMVLLVWFESDHRCP